MSGPQIIALSVFKGELEEIFEEILSVALLSPACSSICEGYIVLLIKLLE